MTTSKMNALKCLGLSTQKRGARDHLWPFYTVSVVVPISTLSAPIVRLTLLAAALAVSSATLLQKHTFTDFLSDHSGREAVAAPPPDNWFDAQLLDHFDDANAKTWGQRYHFNTQWAKGVNHPVFVYINGENEANPAAVTSPNLFMNELAIRWS
ncbi:Aste57867_20970 [Aphanomyces stellatus]|uniref:Aste57867_20970 protein n=1 Tax=Aphanomyces stellatus TaxID=120398 RepID=A0A485LGY1_9STRA|nr:hypothetical protein As57867_020902 [Aphanomyces stellatus]VFT97646.1 Aste57867_20970 [Aphanomyces stellatus]